MRVVVAGYDSSRERWPDVWRCFQLAESAGVVLEEATYTRLWQHALQVGTHNSALCYLSSICPSTHMFLEAEPYTLPS